MSKPIYNLPLHTIENQATTLGAYRQGAAGGQRGFGVRPDQAI